jgi:sulfate transport system ATP-binding protein
VRERNVGFVFQHYALFRHMTVFENVAFGLRVKPRSERPAEAAIRARVKELLDLVQLSHVAARYPTQLSGGQRQRVALARALAVQPKVLLLDEPFGALDAQVRKELRRWLRELHDELHVTSLFVTHDQEEALEVADRVVLMNAGKVEQIGTPAEVYDQPASAFVHSFLGSVNLFRGRVAGQGLGIGEQLLGGPISSQLAEGAAVAYVRPTSWRSCRRMPRVASRHHHPPAAHGAAHPGGTAWQWGYKRCTLRSRAEQGGSPRLCPGQGVRLVAKQAQLYPITRFEGRPRAVQAS